MKLKMSVTSALILVTVQSFLVTIKRLIGLAPEIPSPKPRIGWKGFTYNPELGTLTIHNLWKAYAISVQNTNSMDGLIDEKHIGFMSKDFTIDDLTKGEVVIYRRFLEDSILHSIAYVGEDKKGWFCICKGLNCAFPDPYAIRASDVVSVMRGSFF